MTNCRRPRGDHPELGARSVRVCDLAVAAHTRRETCTHAPLAMYDCALASAVMYAQN